MANKQSTNYRTLTGFRAINFKFKVNVYKKIGDSGKLYH